MIEAMSLVRAVLAGDAAQEGEALRLGKAFADDGRNRRHDRYVIAAMLKQMALERKGLKSRTDMLAEREKAAAELYAEFSDVPEVYRLFLGIARNSTEPKARTVIADLLKKPAPENIKGEAQAMLERFDLPGRKFDLKFRLTNGTEFDLSKHTNPVVLYFWGSWGNATAAAMPLIRSAARNSSAVFVGINCDSHPLPVRDGLKGEPVPGLQRWEPLAVGSPIAKELRVNQVPSVYVFHRGGILKGFGHPKELAALLQGLPK